MAEAGFRPRRTLVFAYFAGEELGLLGSEALVADLPPAPPFSSGRIVAMLNMDMVGRYRPDPGLSIGAVSSSSAWRPLLESIDRRGLNVILDDEVNARSDHASFHRKNIPVLFFFTVNRMQFEIQSLFSGYDGHLSWGTPPPLRRPRKRGKFI